MTDTDFDYRDWHSGQHGEECQLCCAYRDVHAEHRPDWDCPTHPQELDE